ncbi:hypothetical protein FSP39_003330 [Pinctada imbricata]|uniref:Non-specific serine/threonine protein kinase n=1 Tax=Pinctada imbricata TaxID=66713 RepID=A0AA89BUG3_PINIB|nr:hypothetical protein FSP39_003330 [Pinctada imbricata]
MSVPKKANDAMHLSLLEGLEEKVEALGDVFLQDQFTVWDPKQLIKKGRDRHLFLFDMCLIFSKEVKDSNGKAKYQYKFRLMISDVNITEHIEGDETKFALWTGRAPISDYRIILKSKDLETKQNWVKKLRELMQERMQYMHEALKDKQPQLFKPPPKSFHPTRQAPMGLIKREPGGDLDSDDLPIERRRGSFTSMISLATTVTTDSSSSGGEKDRGDVTVVIEDYSAANNSELTVIKGQQVELLDTAPPGEQNWCLVRMINAEDGEPTQGLVPISSLKMIPALQRATNRNSMDLEETMGLPKERSASPVSKRKTSFNRQGGSRSPLPPFTPPPPLCPLLPLLFLLLSPPSHPSYPYSPFRPPPPSPLFPPPPLPFTLSTPSCDQPVKSPVDQADDEAPDITMPPPMEIQTHFTTPPDGSPELPSSLGLKTPTTDPVTGIDLESEIDKLVQKRSDMNSDNRSDGGQASSESGGENNEAEADDGEKEKEKYIQKRRFVLQELINTEKDYVKDLGLVVEGYMEMMKENPMPPGNEGKDKIVFGNIHQIYDWHRESFSHEIQKCLDDAEKLGSLFTRCERRLHMYVKYCENKPKSEYIVAENLDYFEELRQKLGHRLNLPDLLIKPVQRITKYQLLLKDILKYTDRAGENTKALEKALHVMCVVPKAANDMMQVGRLQGFDGKITAQGNLLLHDTLLVAEVMQNKGDQKFKERRVFLFDQIIIFSEMTQRRGDSFTNANYVYKNSLKTNKMIMKCPLPNEPLKFMLIDKSPSSDTRFIIQAQSEEILETWTTKIKSILDMQNDFIDSLTKPQQHAKESVLLVRDSTPDLLPSMGKEPPLRKTWSQPQPGGKGGNSRIPKKDHLRSPSKEGQTSRSKSVPGQIPKVVENDEQRTLKSAVLSDKLGDSYSESASDVNISKSSSTEACSDFHRQHSNSSIGSVSPNIKPKKNILEGLKYKKSKSDSATAPNDQSASMNSSLGNSEQFENFSRTSDRGELDSSQSEETGADQSSDNVHIGKILTDYQAVKEDEISVSRGEIVQVLSSNQQNMFLVYRPASASSPAAEGWIPGHVIGPKEEGNMRKLSWQLFKLRMQGLRPERKISEPAIPVERKCKTLPRSISDFRERVSSPHDLQYEMSPSVLQPLTNVSVQAGDTATLTCRICGRPRPKLTWRFNDSIPVIRGSRVDLKYDEDGFAVLNLYQVTSADSGEYSCLATSNLGSVITRAQITVLDRPGAPRKPKVRNQVGTSVHLEWSPPAYITGDVQIQGYTIEIREINSDMWQAAIPYVPNTSQVIGDLCPGSTYQFRVSSNNSIGMSEPSIESDFVTIPTETEMVENEDGVLTLWKSTYDNDFSEIDEIGRGRFSVVKKCVQKCSGQDVAAKCLNKRQFEREIVELEFNTALSLQHHNLPQMFDLYDNASSLIILMEYFPMGRLFEFICGRPTFDELEAADYISQLLSVSQYLHNCRIAHLDIKPENLLVDGASVPVRLKLIDFGDARHIYNAQYVHTVLGSPEFLAPEIVSRLPVGLVTDIWSIGVILYVLLSGVSPFLDESHEETCANIVNNDYCFPDQYFSGISNEARDLVRAMLTNDLSERPTAQQCMESIWIHRAHTPRSATHRPRSIPIANLRNFIERRKQQDRNIGVLCSDLKHYDHLILQSFLISYSLECYVCNGQFDNRDKCIKTTIQCKKEQDACRSQIRWQQPNFWQPRSNRYFNISKACDSKDNCERDSVNLGIRCMRNHWRDWECVECCQGDRCNFYTTMGSSTIQLSAMLFAFIVSVHVILRLRTVMLR